MTGGGFGGCVVALVRKGLETLKGKVKISQILFLLQAETDKALSVMEIIRNQCKSQNISPILYNCKPCLGSRRLN